MAEIKQANDAAPELPREPTTPDELADDARTDDAEDTSDQTEKDSAG